MEPCPESGRGSGGRPSRTARWSPSQNLAGGPRARLMPSMRLSRRPTGAGDSAGHRGRADGALCRICTGGSTKQSLMTNVIESATGAGHGTLALIDEVADIAE